MLYYKVYRMKLQIVSDLHLEFWAHKSKFQFFETSASILILAGDICCCGSDKDFDIFKRFIDEVAPKYIYIIMVSGNHEYYADQSKADVQLIDKKITAYFAAYNKANKTGARLYYLNNSTLRIQQGNTTYIFVGSTLWSDIKPEHYAQAAEQMNDYRSILYDGRRLKPADVGGMFVRNRAYLTRQINAIAKEATLSNMKYKVIVITHHKPYVSHLRPFVNFAYESDLTPLFRAPVVLWAYGHTHVADDSIQGKTRLYSNPKGYPHQHTKFNANYTVRI